MNTNTKPSQTQAYSHQTDTSVPESWLAYEAKLFVRDLHGDAEGCFVRFLSLSRGRAFDEYVPALDAANVAARKIGEADQYVSLNSFRFRRGPRAGIRTLHADLDFYKVPQWKHATARDVLAAVMDHLATAGIASPSLAVATGQGLQVIWCLDCPVLNRAEPKARTALNGLVKRLASFGADPACADLARAFRLPGTVNSKNGATARLIYRSEERHDFDALCLSILGPKSPKLARQPKPTRPMTARTMRAENASLSHRRLADGDGAERCRKAIATS